MSILQNKLIFGIILLEKYTSYKRGAGMKRMIICGLCLLVFSMLTFAKPREYLNPGYVAGKIRSYSIKKSHQEETQSNLASHFIKEINRIKKSLIKEDMPESKKHYLEGSIEGLKEGFFTPMYKLEKFTQENGGIVVKSYREEFCTPGYATGQVRSYSIKKSHQEETQSNLASHFIKEINRIKESLIKKDMSKREKYFFESFIKGLKDGFSTPMYKLEKFTQENGKMLVEAYKKRAH
jgi:hypothetical protein